MPAIQQGRDGALVDGLETVERALAISSSELAQRPETRRVFGELRLEFGQTELAAVDFRSSIGLARSLSAKSWELLTMSLMVSSTLLACRDEAHATLVDSIIQGPEDRLPWLSWPAAVLVACNI
jgi:hypothetical protein